jgi:hypothetical protein
VNAAVGGGFNIVADRLTLEDKLELYTLEKKINIKKIVPAVTQQLILHNRVYFKLCFDDKMKLTKVINLSPEKLRVNQDKKRYYICDDWASRIRCTERLRRYSPTSKDPEQLFVYEVECIGQDYYSLPAYTSALNFAFLSGELSYFAKSNIQNSVFPIFCYDVP